MKKYLPKIIVRLALTAWMLVYVYRETGPWTVAALALVCIGLECVALALDKLIKAVRDA